MSVDRTPKRKSVSKRSSASPKKIPKKKRPSSPTADNLEALLHLLDDEETSDVGLVPEQKTRKPAAGRASKPLREKPPSADGASSFMQELPRARADLHKERHSRLALEEEAKSLRRELTRLAAHESAELDALQRDCEGLRKQLVTLDKQRQKLQDARFDLESQLDAKQTQREQLNDQLDAVNERLTVECSRRKIIAEDLEATRRACEHLTIEAAASRSAWEAARDELRAELVSMTSRCEQAVQARDALQAAVVQQQSEVAALTERIADAETTIRERDELIQQARNAANEFAQCATAWEERFRQEQSTRTHVEQQLLAALTDASEEKRKAVISLDEAAAKEQLERRVHELGTELAASNQQLAKRQNDAGVNNERIERLEADIAKTKIDLAKSYEQLGATRLHLANSDRDRDHAQQREADALRRANELSDEVESLQAIVQREAAARRKAEAVQKREAGDDEAVALFEAEQKVERLSRELAASKGVEAAYQHKAARKVAQVKQELEALRQRLAEIERRPAGD